MLFNYLQIFKNLVDFFLSHWLLLVLVIFIIIVGLILEVFTAPKPLKYQYKLKDLVMTRSEFEFFKILLSVVQNRYDVFSQIHLDAIMNYQIRGQNWTGARAHISQKSVDFLLCDKDSGKPILAIELDDPSHEREDRIIRDEEVERIFRSINLPLRRIKDKNTPFTKEEVSKEVFGLIESHQ